MKRPPSEFDPARRDEFIQIITDEQYVALKGFLFYLCRGSQLSESMAEDILHDFILTMGDRYQTAEPGYRKAGYLYLRKSLYHFYIDETRKWKREIYPLLPIEEVKEIGCKMDESNPEAENLIFLQRDLFSYMQKVLKGSCDWSIFLQWYQEFSLDEIATELELDFYFVKNRVYRYIKPAYDRFCKTWGKDRA
jgi:DNA-directed RNA polymerase specialized sigma24 family protein